MRLIRRSVKIKAPSGKVLNNFSRFPKQSWNKRQLNGSHVLLNTYFENDNSSGIFDMHAHYSLFDMPYYRVRYESGLETLSTIRFRIDDR